MDIVAKHIPADENGVRIASLDEVTYRKQLWNHRPLTDFWRVGKGYKKNWSRTIFLPWGILQDVLLEKK